MQHTPESSPTQGASATEHVDPVCGMTVEEGPSALTLDYNGTTYYFCSSGCRRAFEKEPAKYLTAGPSMPM